MWLAPTTTQSRTQSPQALWSADRRQATPRWPKSLWTLGTRLTTTLLFHWYPWQTPWHLFKSLAPLTSPVNRLTSPGPETYKWIMDGRRAVARETGPHTGANTHEEIAFLTEILSKTACLNTVFVCSRFRLNHFALRFQRRFITCSKKMQSSCTVLV